MLLKSQRIFSGCTEIILGGIRITTDAQIRGLLHHCGTPTSVVLITNIVIIVVSVIIFFSIIITCTVKFMATKNIAYLYYSLGVLIISQRLLRIQIFNMEPHLI